MIMSNLWALVLGDVKGVPFQFLSRDFINGISSDTWLILYYGDTIAEKRKIEPGTYSDDTAMTLATMDAFVKFNSSNITDDFYKILIKNFQNWLYKGAYTQDGYAWDVGITTERAIDRYPDEITNLEFLGDPELNNSGNGSLMRMAPVAMFLYYKDGVNALRKRENIDLVENVSAITHKSPLCLVYCVIYTQFMLLALDKKINPLTWVLECKRELTRCPLTEEEIEIINKCKIFLSNFSRLLRRDIDGTGFVVDTLKAAVWSVIHSTELNEAIANCVLLGDDTDTTACVAGSLFGHHLKSDMKTVRNYQKVNRYIEEFQDFLIKMQGDK
ncbi:MAG: ADP-ribosylglycohydrolase family protein [Bacilli bacterium]|nr:ADP-ribosylglycohydrolase family protein [Bacilli bacterium]